MASAPQASETQLQISRMIMSPREKVFEAWTKRALLEKWMCRSSGPAQQTKYYELDVRPGGRYRLESVTPTGVVYMLEGTYREIRPPEKLVFTWTWTRTPAGGSPVKENEETLVTVDFFERGKFTEVILTHEKFSTPEIRDNHERGWKGCFDTLDGALKAAEA
jgi:uncharacterized protein YndB with AHSA1/START domain